MASGADLELGGLGARRELVRETEPALGRSWWVRCVPWLTLLVLLFAGPAAPSGADRILELAASYCACGCAGHCDETGCGSEGCCPEGACGAAGCACHAHHGAACAWCPMGRGLALSEPKAGVILPSRVVVRASPVAGVVRPGFLDPPYRPPTV